MNSKASGAQRAGNLNRAESIQQATKVFRFIFVAQSRVTTMGGGFAATIAMELQATTAADLGSGTLLGDLLQSAPTPWLRALGSTQK